MHFNNDEKHLNYYPIDIASCQKKYEFEKIITCMPIKS